MPGRITRVKSRRAARGADSLNAYNQRITDLVGLPRRAPVADRGLLRQLRAIPLAKLLSLKSFLRNHFEFPKNPVSDQFPDGDKPEIKRCRGDLAGGWMFLTQIRLD